MFNCLLVIQLVEQGLKKCFFSFVELFCINNGEILLQKKDVS